MQDESFDWELMVGHARRGDQSACREITSRLSPLISKIVGAHAPRDVSQEEWRHEILVRVLLRLDRYSAKAPFEHWVARVAVNMCMDLLRKRGRNKELRWADLSEEEAEALKSAIADKPVRSRNNASHELVEKLLDTLAVDDRVVITMLDLKQQSVAEIAGQLGRSESWVKVRAHRARKKLKPVLEKIMREQS